MIIEVDPDGAVAPYEQIRRQVLRHLATGALTVGDRLPPVRQLAHDLGIAPGTVARAYRELEHDGVAKGRARTGTTIQARPTPDLTEHVRHQALTDAASTYLETAHRLGYSHEQAADALTTGPESRTAPKIPTRS